MHQFVLSPIAVEFTSWPLAALQPFSTALQAKAKAEAGYRFYAMNDKIRREDILAHAYARIGRHPAHGTEVVGWIGEVWNAPRPTV
jgi:hypothetical protein